MYRYNADRAALEALRRKLDRKKGEGEKVTPYPRRHYSGNDHILFVQNLCIACFTFYTERSLSRDTQPVDAAGRLNFLVLLA